MFLSINYNISGIFKEMKSYFWCIISTLAMLHAHVISADEANDKFKKCCKAYEPLLRNETAVNECLNKYCDFDIISQTNVIIFH